MAAATGAAGIPPEVTVADGGVEKTFVVACESLWCRPDGGAPHVVQVGDRGTPGGLAAWTKTAAVARGTEFDLLLYEKGGGREERARRSLSRRLLVELDGTRPAAAVAAALGAAGFEELPYAPGHAVLRFAEIGDSLAKLPAARAAGGVVSARPLLGKRKVKKLVPDDPRYAWSASNPRYQWHLNNTGQNGSSAGHDVNIAGVWDSYLGDGVTIAIVDDGLQVAHPDLAANVNSSIDHDWNDATPNDPTPDNSIDSHGTSCAGVAAARGNNALGVTGAAPRATLVGLRLIAGDTTPAEDAEALTWEQGIIDISSNSWGESDEGDDLYPLDPLVASAFASGVAAGRGGLGTVYVWAAGNGRDLDDRSNYEGYNNAPETISVGAIDYTGEQAWYSESGANLIVCAPSDADDFEPAITTTTLTSLGSYTTSFGGTSSATPLVAGCAALMLEANPGLGWRDVQEILLRTAEKVDASHIGWQTNGADIDFHHGYGAGMVDAAAAVALAEAWQNLGPRVSTTADSGALSLAIPDASEVGASHALTVSGTGLRVEHALLTVDIEHSYRGDLQIVLTSPDGTDSILAQQHSDPNPDIDFTFLSVRHWGEGADGEWTVKVNDYEEEDEGVLRGLTLTLFGTAAASEYNSWASAHFSGAQLADLSVSGPAADADHDGRPNLYEYALGGLPLVPDTAGEPQWIEEPPGTLRYRYTADTAKADISYKVRTSPDLATWTDLAETVLSTEGSLELREAVLPAGLRQFSRLVVTMP